MDILDLLDPDPDLEPDNDDESYLAGCAHGTGHYIDLEGDDADMEPDVDDEQSLGWTMDYAGRPGSYGACSVAVCDLEGEHDGREPDVDGECQLGWTAAVNQTSVNWFGGDSFFANSDLELDPAEGPQEGDDNGIGDWLGLIEQRGTRWEVAA